MRAPAPRRIIGQCFAIATGQPDQRTREDTTICGAKPTRWRWLTLARGEFDLSPSMTQAEQLPQPNQRPRQAVANLNHTECHDFH